MKFTRRDLVRGAGAAALLPLFPRAGIAGDWAAVEAEARGQTVYFNAWAGSEAINAYICLLYTSDAADELLCVDLGRRRIIKKISLHNMSYTFRPNTSHFFISTNLTY